VPVELLTFAFVTSRSTRGAALKYGGVENKASSPHLSCAVRNGFPTSSLRQALNCEVAQDISDVALPTQHRARTRSAGFASQVDHLVLLRCED
jgi:hypothetical protein